MLLASDEGHVVNTSSVNGFWASLGPASPHTAYSAAKFAVKGFTEALIDRLPPQRPAPQGVGRDARPHRHVDRASTRFAYIGRDPKELTEEQVAEIRERLGRSGLDVSGASDEDIRNGMQMQAEMFRDNAPMTAAAGGDASSSTACAPASGASSSATTPRCSTGSCARRPPRPTSPISCPASRPPACSAASPSDPTRPTGPLTLGSPSAPVHVSARGSRFVTGRSARVHRGQHGRR